MKTFLIVSLIVLTSAGFIALTGNEGPVAIPPSKQRLGNADSGYRYIINGDYVKSGLPLNIYRLGFRKEKANILSRLGENAAVRYDFNVVNAPNGETIVVPNCLQCHAEMFDGKLVMGLGNANGDFTFDRRLNSKSLEKLLLGYLKLNPKKYEAAKEFITVTQSIGDQIFTDAVGANPADRLTALLVAHRDPVTLAWNDQAAIELPADVIPSDVPAWWLLKKKNAMFYNGFGRGDFGKFLMGSALLTITDTVRANEIDTHIPDVLSYIYSIQPPRYPGPVQQSLAATGKKVFENNCSSCHGTYGNDGQYPNLLIPQATIGTDSLLNYSNYKDSRMVEWYNKSWFSKGEYPARLVPFNGYIAPPLDGVWITAPYFHNGSVPTIEAVVNSKLRPAFWTRNFDSTEYDYQRLGWIYKTVTGPGNKYIYNTRLSGYGNQGHYFGDHLTDEERKAVIEYLKTI
jgi:Cytochrome c